jgi:hypothetical protein
MDTNSFFAIMNLFINDFLFLSIEPTKTEYLNYLREVPIL